MTTSKKSRRRWAIFLITSALILLALTWHFAGYVPDSVISLSGDPLAVTPDGKTVIVGTPGEWSCVGPIRFLDLATGKEIQSPVPLKERKKWESWQAGFGHSATTISDAKLSDEGQRLVVVQTGLGEAIGETANYYLTVFDLAAHSVILEKDIPWDNDPRYKPVVQFSHDGRLLGWVSGEPNRCVTVWDLNDGKERFHLPGYMKASFQFSPDGKLLAMSATLAKPGPGQGRFGLFNTATGALVPSIASANGSVVYPPTFSPDGKFVAIDNSGMEVIRVFDTASGKQCFQESKSCWPQFLPGGLLLGVKNSGPAKAEPAYFFIPEIVVWSPDDWTEKRGFIYDLGASPLSGTVMPNPLPLGRANQFALMYETGSGWWTGSSMASKIAGTGLGRTLGLNIPRGLGLDVVDASTGATKTYQLDDSAMWFPYPQAGKILILQSGGKMAVWSITPKRTYRAVWLMAGFLPAIAVLGYGLIFLVRLVWRAARRHRARRQSGPSLEVQL